MKQFNERLDNYVGNKTVGLGSPGPSRTHIQGGAAKRGLGLPLPPRILRGPRKATDPSSQRPLGEKESNVSLARIKVPKERSPGGAAV